MSTRNKEQVYDEEISPLMAQIIAICQQHKIAMLADFVIPTDESPDLRCTSMLPDESGDNHNSHRLAIKAMRYGPSISAALTVMSSGAKQ